MVPTKPLEGFLFASKLNEKKYTVGPNIRKLGRPWPDSCDKTISG